MTKRLDLLETSLFVLFHLCCLLIIWTGVSWTALLMCAGMYAVRIVGITAGYHRYFSHRTFKTSRAFQFVLAFVGASAAQRGPLWWAAHHRYHHKYSDTQQDRHSPAQQGFWWSHVGWFLDSKHFETDYRLIPDLIRYPELRVIDRYYLLPPALLVASLWTTGALLAAWHPALGTSGAQLVVWGFVVSTVLLYHGTFSVNSLCHRIGRRRFATGDDSRNNLFVALVTFGEGWHNNHHYCPASERQGFYAWEIDISHYVLRTLAALGLVWDLRHPPERVYAHAAGTHASGEVR